MSWPKRMAGRSLRSRCLQLILGATALVVAQGCVSDGYGTSVSYGVGFYEPWGYDYGAWGPSYYVGPPRRGSWRPPPRPANPPAFRPPPVGRPMPSLPGGRTVDPDAHAERGS